MFKYCAILDGKNDVMWAYTLERIKSANDTLCREAGQKDAR